MSIPLSPGVLDPLRAVLTAIDIPAEVATALARLRACFEVTNESRPYSDRPPSRLVRVYLDLGPLPAAPDDAS
jgi:hypothetical protein